jgi:hypothetical protein
LSENIFNLYQLRLNKNRSLKNFTDGFNLVSKNRKILAENIDELPETLPRLSSAIKYNPPEGKSSKTPQSSRKTEYNSAL